MARICKTPDCGRISEWFEDHDGGFYDDHCPECNDRRIYRANKAREWAEYHPGVPCPECEME